MKDRKTNFKDKNMTEIANAIQDEADDENLLPSETCLFSDVLREFSCSGNLMRMTHLSDKFPFEPDVFYAVLRDAARTISLVESYEGEGSVNRVFLTPLFRVRAILSFQDSPLPDIVRSLYLILSYCSSSDADDAARLLRARCFDADSPSSSSSLAEYRTRILESVWNAGMRFLEESQVSEDDLDCIRRLLSSPLVEVSEGSEGADGGALRRLTGLVAMEYSEKRNEEYFPPI